MSNFLEIIKHFNLTEMYLALPVEHKDAWYKYFPRMGDADRNRSRAGKFTINSPARLLWITAANAIPHSKYEFAELLLNKALDCAEDTFDKVWCHANMAQLYFDQRKTSSEALTKCREHCTELRKLGFLTTWLKHIMREIGQTENPEIMEQYEDL